jgi:hypothetical protein
MQLRSDWCRRPDAIGVQPRTGVWNRPYGFETSARREKNATLHWRLS